MPVTHARRPRHHLCLNTKAYDFHCAEHGLTSLPAVAEVMGITTSQASRLRRGVNTPGPRLIAEMLHIFGPHATFDMLDVVETEAG